MSRWSLATLLAMELPGGTVRLCDGGAFEWDGHSWTGSDAVFGALRSAENMGEGVGEEVPAIELVFLPAPGAAASSLSQPGFQNSAVRIWLAEYDPETGAVLGTPDLQFLGQIDRTTLTLGRGKRELALTVVSQSERLFQHNAGNSLSPVFHKSVWPGETGEDNATGLGRPVAWGIEAPPGARTSSTTGGGSTSGYTSLVQLGLSRL